MKDPIAFDKQFFADPRKEQMRKVLITPQIAQLWLDKRNKQNRSQGKAAVELLASEMASNKWSATNQGIGFDWDGQLTDGQTRLQAIVLSGVPVSIWVLTGQAPIVRLRIDAGRNRTSAHYLQMYGVGAFDNPDLAAKALWAIRRFGLMHRGRLTGEQTVELAREYRRGLEWICDNAGTGMWRRAPVLGALVFAYMSNPDAVNAANEALKSGVGLAAKDPVLVFRNQMIRGATRPSSDDTNKETFSRLLSAIYHRINGNQVVQLKTSYEAVQYFKNGKTSKGKKQTEIIPQILTGNWIVTKKNNTTKNGHGAEIE